MAQKIGRVMRESPLAAERTRRDRKKHALSTRLWARFSASRLTRRLIVARVQMFAPVQLQDDVADEQAQQGRSETDEGREGENAGERAPGGRIRP